MNAQKSRWRWRHAIYDRFLQSSRKSDCESPVWERNAFSFDTNKWDRYILENRHWLDPFFGLLQVERFSLLLLLWIAWNIILFAESDVRLCDDNLLPSALGLTPAYVTVAYLNWTFKEKKCKYGFHTTFQRHLNIRISGRRFACHHLWILSERNVQYEIRTMLILTHTR